MCCIEARPCLVSCCPSLEGGPKARASPSVHAARAHPSPQVEGPRPSLEEAAISESRSQHWDWLRHKMQVAWRVQCLAWVVLSTTV